MVRLTHARASMGRAPASMVAVSLLSVLTLLLVLRMHIDRASTEVPAAVPAAARTSQSPPPGLPHPESVPVFDGSRAYQLLSAAEHAAAAAAAGATTTSSSGQEWSESLWLDTAAADEEDAYLCTWLPVRGAWVASIEAFEPEVREELVHHMVLFGCRHQPLEGAAAAGGGQSWRCNDSRVVCGGGGSPVVLYAWAHGAGPLVMDEGGPSGFPAGAGLAVGEGVLVGHLVLQVHVTHPRRASEARLRLRMSPRRPERYMSVVLFANSEFRLPPRQPRVAVRCGCCVEERTGLRVHRVRVHAHAYGRNITLSYIGRDHRREVALWGDPQQPQVFQPVPRPPASGGTAGGGLRLPLGREWQVRCEYDTSASEASVSVGMGRSHEMCNMYMMVSAPVPLGAFCGKPLDSPAADDERDADGAEDAGRPEEEAPGGRWPYPLAFAAPHQLRATPLSESRARRVGVIRPPGLGQVAGVHLGYRGDHRKLLVLHRAGRVMRGGAEDERAEPIDADTLLVWDTRSQLLDRSFGRALGMRMPHGLTVDARTGSIWLTDVGSHTVTQLDATGDRVLREVGVPGAAARDAEGRFCAPTEVALAADGTVAFVADGYCNARVVRLALPEREHEDGRGHGEEAGPGRDASSSTGSDRLEYAWELAYEVAGAKVVHGVLMDDCRSLLFVADREGMRVVVIDAGDAPGTVPGSIVRSFGFSANDNKYGVDLHPYALTTDEFGGVFVLLWDRKDRDGGTYVAQIVVGEPESTFDRVEVLRLPGSSSAAGSFPHDFAVSYQPVGDVYHVYVGETPPKGPGSISIYEMPNFN